MAVRAITRSARRPSTSNAAQTEQICCRTLSGSRTVGSRSRAATTRPAIRSESRSKSAAKATGFASYASRRRTTSARSAGSLVAVTSTVSPNRSSSWGLSSPSSGFMVPTSRNLAACRTDSPSRST